MVSKLVVLALVQRADNSIQRMNRYPVHEMYSNQYMLSFDAFFFLFIGPEQTT